MEPKSLYASRRPGTHLAAFSSVDIRPGIPPSSALRCTHLNDAKRKGTWVPRHWWVPCPHGCCLVWNGHEKFYAGPAWLQYLLDHSLRRDAHARTSGDSQFTGFTFDHEMNGIIVGEQGDNRELFVLRVEANEVTREVLRRGDPALPWEPGYRGLDDRPWLAGERPWRSSLDFPPPELEQLPVPQSTPRRRGRMKG